MGLVVAVWAYEHRPGNIEQCVVDGGFVLNTTAYHTTIVFSALLLVAGIVASLKPESRGGRILVLVAIVLVALSLPAIQAMRQAPSRRQLEMSRTGSPAVEPDDPIVPQARKEIESKLLHLNDSWYGYKLNPFGAFPERLVEMKRISVKAEATTLNVADKANGIQWRGTVRIACEVYRTVSVSVDRETKEVEIAGDWGDWQDGGDRCTPLGTVHGGAPVFAANPFAGSPMLDLTVRNGKWEWCVANAPAPTRAILDKAEPSPPVRSSNAMPVPDKTETSLPRPSGSTPSGDDKTSHDAAVASKEDLDRAPTRTQASQARSGLRIELPRRSRSGLDTHAASETDLSDREQHVQGPLSGVWQASTGARFRIDDDGTAITIKLDSSDLLQEFSGTLDRTDNEPDTKSLTGIVDAVFRPEASRRYSIHITATISDPNHLSLRCADWPTWNNAGRSTGKKFLKETLVRTGKASYLSR